MIIIQEEVTGAALACAGSRMRWGCALVNDCAVTVQGNAFMGMSGGYWMLELDPRKSSLDNDEIVSYGNIIPKGFSGDD